ncbi:FG-GAP repeat domain protein [Verrucomicrobiia bacterium DG1235]|nr:FG-GAP repeat domain protein [Verrucomicrobiae bacterium DG1235]
MGPLAKTATFSLSAIVATAAAIFWYAQKSERNEQLAYQARLDQGAALANRCAICHLQPDPSILPKRSWQIMLGDMGLLLGIRDQEYFEQMPGFAKVSQQRRQVHQHFNILPAGQLITEEEWADLKFYYLETAPEVPLPPPAKPEINWTLDQFEIQKPRNRLPSAFTTLTRIKPDTQELYLGDSGQNTLSIFDPNGRRKGLPIRLPTPITPVDIAFHGQTTFIASIGDVRGTDMIGRPGFITRYDQKTGDSHVIIEQLHRLADLELADLDGDQIPELITSGFGTAVGRLSSFWSEGDSYTERPLVELPGAVKAQAHDFNQDGLLDVAALFGNAREGLHILTNRGDGAFSDRLIFQTHPGMGHTYFEIQDFNADGRADLLVVNGDNVDSDPYNTLKNHHGLRILLAQEDGSFLQSYFYPMQGAFIAKAADFDLDGDLDIAAIAYYPDFASSRPENFVYLENQGNLSFAPSSDETLNQGRWMTMDAGDIDGDGDPDIALGGAYTPLGMSHYKAQYEKLTKTGEAFLILKNQTR